MDIKRNYIEAVKTIKEAILRSQYRAAASVNKEPIYISYTSDLYVLRVPSIYPARPIYRCSKQLLSFVSSSHSQRFILCCLHNLPFSRSFIINTAKMQNTVDNNPV